MAVLSNFQTSLIFRQGRVWIECPGNLAKQGHCYSNYKHYCTLKVMIFVTPAGGAAHISMPFEGSCSDRHIFSQMEVIDEFDSRNTLTIVKTDGEPTNTGWKGQCGLSMRLQ